MKRLHRRGDHWWTDRADRRSRGEIRQFSPPADTERRPTHAVSGQRPPSIGWQRDEGDRMLQTLRTLGAGALGAFIVAIAALSVRTGPVSGAPAVTTPAEPRSTVSANGKVTVVPDVAR